MRGALPTAAAARRTRCVAQTVAGQSLEQDLQEVVRRHQLHQLSQLRKLLQFDVFRIRGGLVTKKLC